MSKHDPMTLAAQLMSQAPDQRPPVDQWDPPFCGDIDIRITSDGQWFHEGSPFTRPALVRLFSNILRREKSGDYCLVTPQEKVRIQVDDVPFVIVRWAWQSQSSVPVLTLTTQVGDEVEVGPAHPITLRDALDEPEDSDPLPYVQVRSGLLARLGRNVFYQLIDQGRLEPDESGEVLVIESHGQCYPLGHLPDEGSAV